MWAFVKGIVTQMFNVHKASQILLFIISWGILIIITYWAIHQIREIIEKTRESENTQGGSANYRNRANYIAIIVGLVFIVILFKQPYLDMLFQGKRTSYQLKLVLYTGSLGTGWVIWYLRQLQKYGEFFHVFLFTSIAGLCWYARLAAPEEIQVTAVTFLLGSLFRVAKDYLDRAEREQTGEEQTNKDSKPWES